MAIIIISPINCFAPVEYWQTKPKCRSPGCRLQCCNLVMLKSTLSQSQCKVQAPFSAPPYEQFNTFVFVYRQAAMRVILF
jgi:hypothetical protein